MHRRSFISAIIALPVATMAPSANGAGPMTLSHSGELLRIQKRIVEAELEVKKTGMVVVSADGQHMPNPWLTISRQYRQMLVMKMQAMRTP